MKPDRILLAEIKRCDARDFCESCWFWSAVEAWRPFTRPRQKMPSFRWQNIIRTGMSRIFLFWCSFRKIIMDSIDIVVHVGRDGVVRHMSDIYYKGAECEKLLISHQICFIFAVILVAAWFAQVHLFSFVLYFSQIKNLKPLKAVFQDPLMRTGWIFFTDNNPLFWLRISEF